MIVSCSRISVSTASLCGCLFSITCPNLFTCVLFVSGLWNSVSTCVTEWSSISSSLPPTHLGECQTEGSVSSEGLLSLMEAWHWRVCCLLVPTQVEPAWTGSSSSTHALVCVAHGRSWNHICLQLPWKVSSVYSRTASRLFMSLMCSFKSVCSTRPWSVSLDNPFLNILSVDVDISSTDKITMNHFFKEKLRKVSCFLLLECEFLLVFSSYS